MAILGVILSIVMPIIGAIGYLYDNNICIIICAVYLVLQAINDIARGKPMHVINGFVWAIVIYGCAIMFQTDYWRMNYMLFGFDVHYITDTYYHLLLYLFLGFLVYDVGITIGNSFLMFFIKKICKHIETNVVRVIVAITPVIISAVFTVLLFYLRYSIIAATMTEVQLQWLR